MTTTPDGLADAADPEGIAEGSRWLSEAMPPVGRRGEEADPEGIAEGSRWLSAAIPPVRRRDEEADPGGIAEGRRWSSNASHQNHLSGHMMLPTASPDTWVYHNDFAQILVTRDDEVVLRLLQCADIALGFARALVAGDFEGARSMLAASLKDSLSADSLRREMESMCSWSGDDAGRPDLVQVVKGMDGSEFRGSDTCGMGWIYVAICGDGYCEAVTVTIDVEGYRLVIRKLEWGRP